MPKPIKPKTMKKLCTRCNTTKDISLFYKDQRRKDGRAKDCKKCQELARNDRGRTKLRTTSYKDSQNKEEYLQELQELYKLNDSEIIAGLIENCKKDIENQKGKFVI